MTSLKTVLAAALLTAGLSSAAQAALTPISSQLFASGPMDVVFAFKEAADRSQLFWDQAGGPAAPGTSLIINNGAGVNPVGFTVENFGIAGPVDFYLRNHAQGYTFRAGVLAFDGIQHAVRSTNFADFKTVNGGPGPIPLAARTAINSLGGGLGLDPLNTTVSKGFFIGFEDRRDCSTNFPCAPGIRAADKDFNDLIYWFDSVSTTGVPTPAALALFGMGLLGLGLARRRRA